MAKQWAYMTATCWWEHPDTVMVKEQEVFNALLADGWRPHLMAVDPGWPIRARVLLRKRVR